MKKSVYSSVLAIIFLFAAFSANAQRTKDPIEHIWYNQEKTSKIEVYLAKDGRYYGKIVWLKEPTDKETGKPRTDKENEDESLRNTPLLGLVIMKAYKKNSDNPKEYSDGTIYDPKKGKTYCGKITLNDDKTLDLRGFICSASFLGRTSKWTLAED